MARRAGQLQRRVRVQFKHAPRTRLARREEIGHEACRADEGRAHAAPSVDVEQERLHVKLISHDALNLELRRLASAQELRSTVPARPDALHGGGALATR